jgi:signal transduction histidine kinase
VEDGVVALDEKGLSIIRSELDRLLSTTDSIMQYEKVVALKEKHAQTTEFDITPILTNLRDEYLPTLARNSQMIRFEEKPFFVRLEKDLMIQMIHNVFSNFTKYAGQGATLTTRMARRSRRITFNFDDDGRGVAKENVPYLREKFYQEDSGRSGSQTSRGIGIGLSLIEKIAKVHGGHITIVSDTGRGFRLKVVLEQPDIPEQAMESPSEETLH